MNHHVYAHTYYISIYAYFICPPEYALFSVNCIRMEQLCNLLCYWCPFHSVSAVRTTSGDIRVTSEIQPDCQNYCHATIRMQ